jgi:TPR repeat protein
MYEDGVGVKQSRLKMMKYYQKACGLDNGNGCFSLGVIYKNDENTKKNDFKAVKFYQKACDLGNSI